MLADAEIRDWRGSARTPGRSRSSSGREVPGCRWSDRSGGLLARGQRGSTRPSRRRARWRPRIRPFLVADLGVLMSSATRRRAIRRPRPQDVRATPCANPATARTLEELGATTINASTTCRRRSSASCARPLAPPTCMPRCRTTGQVRALHGSWRSSRSPGLREAFRNALVPSGPHLEDWRAGRERRRVELVLRLLEERAPGLVEGRGADRPADLGIPEP
jgi:hypothetical protein